MFIIFKFYVRACIWFWIHLFVGLFSISDLISVLFFVFRFTFYILDSCASLSFYIQSFASRGQNCLHSFIFLLLLQLTSKNRKMVDHSFAFTLQIIVEHKNLCKRTSMKLDKTLQCHTQPNNSIVFIFDECRSIYLT